MEGIAKIKYLVLLLVLAFAMPVSSNAQCISFAKNVCKSKLGEYIHDGNYNATVIGEGENAELYKTFFSGQSYRLAVCNVDDLPPIRIKVMDTDRNVLYDNKNYEYSQVWDFEVKSTQMLIIKVEVTESNSHSDELLRGCMAILFGVK